MKTLALAALCMIIVNSSFAQPSFNISGRIKGLNLGTAKLNYITEQQTKQISAEINKGSFVFKGSLPGPELLQISFSSESGNREIRFFAGNDQVTLSLDTSHWDNPEISGSASQKEFEGLELKTKSVDEKSAVLNKTGSALYLS